MAVMILGHNLLDPKLVRKKTAPNETHFKTTWTLNVFVNPITHLTEYATAS